MLYEGAAKFVFAAKGSSRRSHLPPNAQNREYAVLNYLEDGSAAKASALRSATQARKALLDAMVRKKWLIREALAEERDARRTERIAILVPDARIPKLNDNQTAILAELAPLEAGMRVAICACPHPPRTQRSCVHPRHAGQARPGRHRRSSRRLPPRRPSRQRQENAHEHALNEAQMEALSSIVAALAQEERL